MYLKALDENAEGQDSHHVHYTLLKQTSTQNTPD